MTVAVDTLSVRSRDSGLLLLALRIDAIGSALTGVLTLALAPMLEAPLGLPAALSWSVGVGLLVWAAWLWFGVARPDFHPMAVKAVVALNAVWVLASVGLVVSGAVPLTQNGAVLVIGQAVAVAVIADLEWLGLRRARRQSA